MSKTMAGSLLAALLLSAQSGTANAAETDNIDFSTIDCATFVSDIAAAGEDDTAAVMMWLDGYLSGVSSDTVLRFDGLGDFGTDLVEHCAKNGKAKLLDAAREVGLQ